MNQLPSTRARVVILGGGFAGLNAAKALRRAPVDVVIIDRNNYHLFQPLLYQVATAGLSADDIASPIRAVLKRHANTQVMLANAISIDADAQTVQLDDGSIDYDFLICATGMENNYFGHDDWREFAPGLKTMNDALQCRERILNAYEQAERASDPDEIKALLTFVIVGAGATGVELAGAVREIGYQVMVNDFRRIDPASACVILVDAGERVLSGYDEKLSRRAQRDLEQRGVKVRLNTPVQQIRDDGVVLDNEFIPAHTVIWAAGVKATSLVQSLNAPADRMGRIYVKPDLTVPQHDNIYIIGDLAHIKDSDTGEVLPGLAPVAIQQGKWAARHIEQRVRHVPQLLSSKIKDREFKYRDRGQMATIGRASAIAQIRGWRFGGYFAWLLWLVVHLLFLIGFRNRLMVILDWAYAYIGLRRSARLIIPVDNNLSHRLPAE